MCRDGGLSIEVWGGRPVCDGDCTCVCPSVRPSVRPVQFQTPPPLTHQPRNAPQEEDAIVIDRFDGRALLDDRALFMKKKSRRRCVPSRV